MIKPPTPKEVPLLHRPSRCMHASAHYGARPLHRCRCCASSRPSRCMHASAHHGARPLHRCRCCASSRPSRCMHASAHHGARPLHRCRCSMASGSNRMLAGMAPPGLGRPTRRPTCPPRRLECRRVCRWGQARCARSTSCSRPTAT
jgi:hypothetical protein